MMNNSLEVNGVEPKKFDWRKHARGVEHLPQEAIEKLDQLESLINEDGPDVQGFLTALNKGQYRTPVLAMISYFRGVLTPEEMGQLHDAITGVDPQRYIK